MCVSICRLKKQLIWAGWTWNSYLSTQTGCEPQSLTFLLRSELKLQPGMQVCSSSNPTVLIKYKGWYWWIMSWWHKSTWPAICARSVNWHGDSYLLWLGLNGFVDLDIVSVGLDYQNNKMSRSNIWYFCSRTGLVCLGKLMKALRHLAQTALTPTAVGAHCT